MQSQILIPNAVRFLKHSFDIMLFSDTPRCQLVVLALQALASTVCLLRFQSTIFTYYFTRPNWCVCITTAGQDLEVQTGQSTQKDKSHLSVPMVESCTFTVKANMRWRCFPCNVVSTWRISMFFNFSFSEVEYQNLIL